MTRAGDESDDDDDNDDDGERGGNSLTMNVNVSIFKTWCRIIFVSYIYDITNEIKTYSKLWMPVLFL